MMNLKLALLAAAGSLAMVTGAHAQDSGYYGALGAGVVLESDDNDFESFDSAPAAFDSDLDLGSDVALYGAIGKYFEDGFRGELELATRSQEVDGLSNVGANFPSDGSMGDFSVTTLMLNGYKDFNIDVAARLNPYLGVGVGVARVRADFDNLGAAHATSVAQMGVSNNIVIADTEYVPALQGMAGLTFDFTENMMLDVRYRYLLADEADFGAYVNGGTLSTIDSDYDGHEITAGFRWNFGATAAAPAPVAVQYKTCFDGTRLPVTDECPAQIVEDDVVEMDPLVVYFDFAKSNLTDAAQTLISARAQEALEGDVQTVTVSGHTDTVGSAASNLRLSQRRASVVRDALIQSGVDADAIEVEYFGQSQPAKATPDGTREPLNRRTEVDFGF
ncbi:MAG: OmpA family protein [Pseudomonadota bacterium]